MGAVWGLILRWGDLESLSAGHIICLWGGHTESVIFGQPNQAKSHRKHARMDKYGDRVVWALQVWTGLFRETGDYVLQYSLCAEGNAVHVEG